jgi:hypothetical protein
MSYLSNISNLNFVEFFNDIFREFQEECFMLLTSADASPSSGNPKANIDSYIFKVLPLLKVDDTREFDRATLSLKAFFDVIQGVNNFDLSNQNLQKIKNWVLSNIKNDEDLFSWSYSILFNDLGKLHLSNKKHIELFGYQSSEHDVCFTNILKKSPEFYPNFKKLPLKYQKSLINGLEINFNLGKCLFLESSHKIWDNTKKISDWDFQFLLGHSFFDICGITGAKNPLKVSILNDSFVENFFLVLETKNNFKFAEKILELNNYDYYNEYPYSIAKILASIKCFDGTKNEIIFNAWNSLDIKKQFLLNNEFVNIGSSDFPFLELQYSPSILMKCSNSKEMLAVLNKFYDILKYIRSQIEFINNPKDYYVVNLRQLSFHINQNFEKGLKWSEKINFEQTPDGFIIKE